MNLDCVQESRRSLVVQKDRPEGSLGVELTLSLSHDLSSRRQEVVCLGMDDVDLKNKAVRILEEAELWPDLVEKHRR